MNSLSGFLASILPKGTLESITDKAFTLMRSGMTSLRHPQHQSGMVLAEDGSVDLKAGTGVSPASLTLNAHGTAQICAPGSVSVVGPLLLSGSPSEGIRFSYGDVQLNPLLESIELYWLTPAQKQAQIGVFKGGSDIPQPVSLIDLLTPVTVYLDSSLDPNSLHNVTQKAIASFVK